jgi:Ankyrin repeats (3 copies)/F-box-like
MPSTKEKSLFAVLPLELLLLIMRDLEDLKDVVAMARTCRSMHTVLEPMLYERVITTGAYKRKLLYAAIYGQANAVSKLLKMGAEMDGFKCHTADYIEVCWEIYAAHNNRTFPVTSLMKRRMLGFDFHPLLAAAVFGHVDVVRTLLIEGMVDINFKDLSQNTALVYAIGNNHPDVIKLLLEQGASCSTVNKNKPVSKHVRRGLLISSNFSSFTA